MGKTEKLEIKRASSDLICWKVDAANITPNTLIVPDTGLNAIIKLDGEEFTTMAPCTVYSLVKPGKQKKLFGGKSSYDNCEIYAVDVKGEFSAEWGLGGDSAIPFKDDELDVDCYLVAYGSYSFKISNYITLLNSVPRNEGRLRRVDIREFLRAKTTGVIRSYLQSQVSGRDLTTAQRNCRQYEEFIMEELRNVLLQNGLIPLSFSIQSIDYAPEHLRKRTAIGNAKVQRTLTGIEADTAKIVINVEGTHVQEVEAPRADVYKTIKQADASVQSPVVRDAHDSRPERKFTVICPRCGTENDAAANYCARCGESLRRK